MDARREKRYQVQAVVKFTWPTLANETETSIGRTRDISSGGIFVVAAPTLPVGTWVHLDVTLPGLRNREGARLTSMGCVIRSENSGFAVAAQSKFGLRFNRENNHDSQTLPGVEPGAEGQGVVPAQTVEAGAPQVARFEGK